MRTKILATWLLGAVLSLALAGDGPAQTPAAAPAASAPAPANAAQPAPPPAADAKRSAAELEKLVAPIALYPDQLLATVLPASVYPLEIVQAARFVADTNNLAKLDEQPWDDSVKAVARVPGAIKKLNDDLSWTMQLGEAFLAQDKDVMDAIQSMRNKARTAGTLQTTAQQIVTVTNMVVEQTVGEKVVVVTNTIVQIAPADPTVVYVPSYPYTVYYPPPGYVYNPMAPLISFGIAVGIGAIIHNNCDWHHGGCYHGDVDVNVDRNVNRNVDRNVNRAGQTGSQKKWQPDQNRLSRSGAPRAADSARSAQARGWGGAGNQAAPRPTTQRPTASTGARPGQSPTHNWTQPSANRPGAAPGQSPTGVRPASVPSVQRPSVSRPTTANVQSANRPAPSAAPSVNRSAGQAGSAFSGVNNGARANNFSNRGAASRGGGGGARGGGGRR